jgi:hypothetical protein
MWGVAFQGWRSLRELTAWLFSVIPPGSRRGGSLGFRKVGPVPVGRPFVEVNDFIAVDEEAAEGFVWEIVEADDPVRITNDCFKHDVVSAGGGAPGNGDVQFRVIFPVIGYGHGDPVHGQERWRQIGSCIV